MPVTYQIDYLEFPSTDGLKTRRFFEEAFEWSFVSYGPTYHAIEAAGIDAGIQGDAAAATDAPLPVVRTTDEDRAVVATFLQANGADGDERLVVLHPGGEGFRGRTVDGVAARGAVDDDRCDGIDRERNLLFLCSWGFLCSFDSHEFAELFASHRSLRFGLHCKT